LISPVVDLIVVGVGGLLLIWFSIPRTARPGMVTAFRRGWAGSDREEP
jgi:hypothetical protein